jgi:hypothetical protein
MKSRTTIRKNKTSKRVGQEKKGREDKEEPEKRKGDKEMYYCHPAI